MQKDDIAKARKTFGRAMDTFKIILQKNHSNIYAANGMAAIMAEQGHLEQAQKIFTQVVAHFNRAQLEQSPTNFCVTSYVLW